VEAAPENVEAAPEKVEAAPEKVEAVPEKVEAAPEQVDEAAAENANEVEAKEEPLDPKDDVHIMFSTGCNPYQHWQSEVMFWNWHNVGHRGRITRIASGCHTDQNRDLARKTAVDSDKIGTFIVKEAENKQHKWLNKPVGLKEFLSKAEIKESILILLDPDMVIVKPFDVQNVSEGNPIAQKYGIGPKWLRWKLCDSDMCKINDRDGWKWYSVGPPIMMHINDWRKVADSWYKYSPEVYKHDSTILSDMYSYAVGAADNNIRHLTVTNMMVSDANIRTDEAWPIINTKNYEKLSILEPNVLHFCQTYYLGQNYRDSSLAWGTFNWHKGHLPHDILVRCDYNLLVEVEINEENLKKDKTKDGRHLWMLHHLISRVNAALENYKLKYCPDWVSKKDIVLIQPESDRKNRMWYLLDHFDDSGKRNNLRNTNGRRRRLLSGEYFIEYWDM